MAYPYRFGKVQIIGDSFSGNEIWTTSFHVGSPSGHASEPSVAVAGLIAQKWVNFTNTTGSGFGTNYRTLGVKYNLFGEDGKQITDPTVESWLATPVAGITANGTGLPPQVTLVASLRTGSNRGLATKGRMYLPCNAWAPGTNGKIASTSVNTVATAFQTFINAVNEVLPPADQVILTSNPAGTVGKSNTVFEIRIGDVLDTQRRRRNNLQETYVSRGIVT